MENKEGNKKILSSNNFLVDFMDVNDNILVDISLNECEVIRVEHFFRNTNSEVNVYLFSPFNLLRREDFNKIKKIRVVILDDLKSPQDAYVYNMLSYEVVLTNDTSVEQPLIYILKILI